MFPVENLQARLSGNKEAVHPDANSYGTVTVTKWADDRDAAFSFSFDDGFISQYVNVREILNQHNFKGTFYILPPFLTDSLPGIWRYGTWPMFEEMSSEGYELGSHTLNHDSLPNLPIGDTLTPGTLHYELYQSRKMINDRIGEPKCITFAYPYAVHNSLVDSLTGIYYESARSVDDYPNPAEIYGNEWYNLSSYQIEFSMPRNSLADDLDELYNFIGWITDAINNGEWGIHIAHEVVPFSELNDLLGEGAYEPISNEWLTDLCDWLEIKSNSYEIWVETIATITKYVKERESFYYNILTQTNELIEIEAGDNLRDEIYNYPLTAYITVPPDWDYVLLEQGSNTDVLESFILDTSFVVMGEVIPDGGIVTLSKYIPNYISENENEQPDKFKLYQNYPNPFNPSTKIRFEIPQSVILSSAENLIFVQLKIYDVLGNEIATLVNEEKFAGDYTVTFDASHLPTGVYIYTLQTSGNLISKKMLLLK